MNETMPKRKSLQPPLRKSWGVRFTAAQHENIAKYCALHNVQKSTLIRCIVGDILEMYFQNFEDKKTSEAEVF
jgi:hypothetical protein